MTRKMNQENKSMIPKAFTVTCATACIKPLPIFDSQSKQMRIATSNEWNLKFFIWAYKKEALDYKRNSCTLNNTNFLGILSSFHQKSIIFFIKLL